MKIVKYEKKDRGALLGQLDIEVLLDYDGTPRPILIRSLKHFKSQKSGKEWVTWPDERLWESEEKKYQPILEFMGEGDKYPFSDKILELLKSFEHAEPEEPQDLPF